MLCPIFVGESEVFGICYFRTIRHYLSLYNNIFFLHNHLFFNVVSPLVHKFVDALRRKRFWLAKKLCLHYIFTYWLLLNWCPL